MSADATPLCLGCRRPVGDPPALHALPSGAPCPRCRERVLDSLPPLLPAGGFGARADRLAEAGGGDAGAARPAGRPVLRLLPPASGEARGEGR